MNRKELIDKAALEYAQTRSEDRGITYLTFKDIAEWADRTMIDKACEWLEDMDFEFEYHYSEDGFVFFDKEKFINDFRKVMEE